GTDDLVRAPGLEDATVMHQPQTPHRWLRHYLITGPVVTGSQHRKPGQHALEPPQWLAVLPNCQGNRLLQNICCANTGIRARQLQPPVKATRQAFEKLETNYREKIMTKAANHGGKLQSVCLGHVFGP